MRPLKTARAIELAFRASLDIRSDSRVEVSSELNVEKLAENDRPLSEAEIARRFFFGASDKLSATIGRAHPYLHGQNHPSTVDGWVSLMNRLRLGNLQTRDAIVTRVIQGSAAVLGGPAANLHARLVMGCGGVSPLFGKPLPITFDCRPNLAARHDERWNVVVDQRTSQKECLVITSIPMEHDRLVLFSGLHSAGTRAIDLVLKNERFLEKLYRRSRTLIAWQAIIEVSSPDNERAKSLGDFEMCEITGINFDDPSLRIRERLSLNDSVSAELIQMLPPIPLEQMAPLTLRKSGERDIMQPAPGRGRALANAAPSNLKSGTNPRRRAAPSVTVHEPRKGNEANMDQADLSSNPKGKRRFGRPPKPKSNASLTQRLTILLSHEDLELLQLTMQEMGTASMGQTLRELIRHASRSRQKKSQ